jgi:predicted phage terminase large subunit-like protein
VRPYLRATCNPVVDDDPVGGWLHQLVQWWLDPETGLPIPARSGAVRWFVRAGERLEWADDPARLRALGPDLIPKSFAFIAGRLEDNPTLMQGDPGYLANLMALAAVERERLRGGNWNARPAAGKVFNRAWFEIVDAAPAEMDRVRAWDKAGTEGAGNWTAGVRMGKSAGGLYWVEDVVRGQWGSARRNAVIRQTAALDGEAVEVRVEQEPGSGGKESAEISVRELAGYDVRTAPATGSKLTRALPFSAQAEAGNVKLVRGPWNKAYLDELHNFTGADGGADDQVDPSAAAFNRLALKPGPLRLLNAPAARTPEEQAAEDAERRARAEAEVRERVARDGVYWPGRGR